VALFQRDVEINLHDRRVVARQGVSRGRWARTVTLERQRPALGSVAHALFRGGFESVLSSGQYDVVWYVKLNAVWLTGCLALSTPSVCDVDDFEAKTYSRAISLLPAPQRALATLDYRLLVRAQRRAAEACDLLLFANPEDVAAATAMTGRRARAVPNGYDFSMPPDFDRPRNARVVFIGALGYRPNLDGLRWFVREVWPGIRRTVPGARLDVGGASTAETDSLDGEPGVRLCGFVDDIAAFVEDAAVLVVPLRMGGGTRIKILEAWARGLPVVSTSVGCEGLRAENGVHLKVADKASDFEAACVGLLRDPAEGRIMARKSFEHGRLNFDWSVVDKELQEALETVTLLDGT
jgi:glycosyltransferase involved in cell wall biosynthesis